MSLLLSTHTYYRREPEKEVLYQVIAENLETFLERIRIKGHELPQYVAEEFYRYLDCGILARYIVGEGLP